MEEKVESNKRKRVSSRKYKGVYWFEPYDSRRGKTFYIDLRVGGQKVRRCVGSSSDGLTLELADTFRKLLMAKIRKGEIVTFGDLDRHFPNRQSSESTITLNFVYNRYLEWAKLNKKSWKNDESLYNCRIRPRFGSAPLDQLRSKHIEDFKNTLYKAESHRGGALSDATVKHYLILIRRIINYAIQNDLFEGPNPFNKVKLKHINNKVTEYLTSHQSQALLNVLNNFPDKTTANIIKFAYFTGLRRGEIFSLRWTDVNLAQNEILIRDPKSGRDEIAYLSEPAKRVIEEQTQRKFPSDEFVFSGKNGNKRNDIKRSWATIKKLADLPEDFRFHGLRHNFATQLARDPNISIFQLQAVMRHKNIKTTQRYIDVSERDIRAAVISFANQSVGGNK